MTAPGWLLLTICLLELGLLLAFAWHRQWWDVMYWLGVLFINSVLIQRAINVGH